jgi:hypothetical protein
VESELPLDIEEWDLNAVPEIQDISTTETPGQAVKKIIEKKNMLKVISRNPFVETTETIMAPVCCSLENVQFALVGYNLPMEQIEIEKKPLIDYLLSCGAIYISKPNWPTLINTKKTTLVVICKYFWARFWEFTWFKDARTNPYLRFLRNSNFLVEIKKIGSLPSLASFVHGL